jgi:hypothetical protein
VSRALGHTQRHSTHAKKADAMMQLQEPKTRKQLCGFVAGMINHCRDVWKQRSHVFARACTTYDLDLCEHPMEMG